MIYLDYNATTPIDKGVGDAMSPYLRTDFGNPSSSHAAGAAAKAAVETARGQVARLLGCDTGEVVFTSGGSESNNTALKGVAYALRDMGRHIITQSTEHPAVLSPCRFLQSCGYQVTYLPVDGAGMVDPDDVALAAGPGTILVTIMHANNETGTIQPIREIADVCRKRGVLFHTDTAQSVGKIPVRVDELGVDMLTVAGHKLYAPKGIGALYIRAGVKIEPLIHGAGHEGGRRAGTENVPYAVALGKACELAEAAGANERARQLRDRLHKELLARFGDRLRLNGHADLRLPNTLNVSFLGRDSAEVMEWMPGVAVSAGSACHAGGTSISPVLAAMGRSAEQGRGAIRFSLGRMTTQEEVDAVVGMLEKR